MDYWYREVVLEERIRITYLYERANEQARVKLDDINLFIAPDLWSSLHTRPRRNLQVVPS